MTTVLPSFPPYPTSTQQAHTFCTPTLTRTSQAWPGPRLFLKLKCFPQGHPSVRVHIQRGKRNRRANVKLLSLEFSQKYSAFLVLWCTARGRASRRSFRGDVWGPTGPGTSSAREALRRLPRSPRGLHCRRVCPCAAPSTLACFHSAQK